MEAITYTNARNNLAKTMDKVNDDHLTVLITRQNGEPVVMLSLANYNSMQETAYLLKCPANAERLTRAVKAAKSKKLTKRRLVPDD
ncbi:MAG: type II toxin-antitoxin system prevent-host-death family antitoxin [Casimicrobiaceae bacterium]